MNLNNKVYQLKQEKDNINIIIQKYEIYSIN